MKRTITLQVDVESFEEYAEVVAAVVQQKGVAKASWTRGEEIRDLLDQRHGIDAGWGSGSVHDGFGLRGSR